MLTIRYAADSVHVSRTVYLYVNCILERFDMVSVLCSYMKLYRYFAVLCRHTATGAPAKFVLFGAPPKEKKSKNTILAAIILRWTW